MAQILFDADNHYYEPRDAFTRHIDPAYRSRAVRPVRSEDGSEQILVGDRLFTYMAPQYEKTLAPGALRERLRSIAGGEVGRVFDDQQVQRIPTAYTDRDERIALMDEQGLDACLMFPTLAVCVEHFMKDDPRLVAANFEAFNRWLEDDWGFAYRNRIFSAAAISLLDLDAAVAELERLLDRGLRVLYLRPGPQGRRSPADPHFDPFWARVQEAGVVVASHSSESGYNELFSSYWSETGNPDCHEQSAFQWTNFFGDRPIMDTLSAMVLHNLFGRFPGLKVVTVENGSIWVPYLLKVMDKMKGMGRSGRWVGGEVKGRPSEIFTEHVWVVPFHEEKVAPLVEAIGAERVLFGSDYPHAEGLANPADFAKGLVGLGDADTAKIMGGNLAGILGLS
jgi:predicted TIM-barrel fold metal-dependent hydrolase